MVDRIKVGFVDYELAYLDGADMASCNTAGFCNTHQHRIGIADYLSPESQAETLLHEIFHAIIESWGMEVSGEESIVRPLALGLAAVIRDNPSLARDIVKKLTASR